MSDSDVYKQCALFDAERCGPWRQPRNEQHGLVRVADLVRDTDDHIATFKFRF